MAATGAISRYLPVYGKQLGISPLIMGSIIAIVPIASFIGKLILGYTADYYLEWRKAIFMALFAMTGASYFLMYFLPPLPGPILPDHEFQNVSWNSLLPCDTNHRATILLCNGVKDTTCHWICKDMNFSMRLSFHAPNKEAIISSDTTCLLNVNKASLYQRNVTTNYNCNVTCDNFEDDQCLYTSTTFWGFVILMLLGEIGYHISLSASDVICFDILGEDGQMRYGRQRLWGTIGSSLLSLLSGLTIDLWSQQKVYKTYTPAFILVLVFIIIDLICCRKLKLPLSKSPSILKNVYAILKLVPIIIFLCTAMFAGIFESLMVNFLFWYIEDLAMATGYMKKVKLIEGLTLSSGLLGKVISYFMSGKILEKFGYDYTLTFCFLCYALRMALLSLVPTPWHVLLIEVILQGPSLALLYATIVTYASIISPPGTSATVQAIATGTKDGLGYAIGSFLGGFLFRKIGGQRTLRVYSGLAILSALVYIILYTLYIKRTSDTRNKVEWKKHDDAHREYIIDEKCVHVSSYKHVSYVPS
ncbi:PREDICTED: major facilitator superfamily domain-containing protein 6-like [Acromyrmex echinatior]|uniref:major facilitator superfamily domain-containing protein 6-like n=1 Tax=Acromyrmex echinatior TaxID=103372 RepID=UPI000580F9EA|nr:PREDICTED: major facilitator superfamily domain-containing protein 6-like [Acromyrmex echinatior]